MFIAEIPQDREPQVQIVLKVADPDIFRADPVVEVLTPFVDTHFGTKMMTVRDPDDGWRRRPDTDPSATPKA